MTRTRMARRMAEQGTRGAHADAQHLAASPAFQAIHVDDPTLDVDTSDGYRPGLPAITAFCRR